MGLFDRKPAKPGDPGDSVAEDSKDAKDAKDAVAGTDSSDAKGATDAVDASESAGRVDHTDDDLFEAIDSVDAIDVPDTTRPLSVGPVSPAREEQGATVTDAASDENAPDESAVKDDSSDSAGSEKPDAADTADAADSADTADAEDIEAPRPKRDIYAVSGRARPQKIEPRGDDSRTEVFTAASADPAYGTQTSQDVPDSEESGHETLAFGGGLGAAGAAATPRRSAIPEPTDSQNPAQAPADAGEGATAVFAPTAAGTAGTAGAAGTAGVVASGEEDAAEAVDENGEPVSTVPAEAEAKRGTLDLGLFFLRVVVGALLIVRGLQTLFAFGGDPGISAFEQTLSAYNFADILAVALPVAEIVAGGLLVFGLLTPVGSALAVVVAGFLTLHNLSLWDSGYWPYTLSPHVQFWGLLTLVGLVLTFTGPGRYSADISRGWATRPLASAWLFALIGVAGAAGLWLAVSGGNPF